MPGRRRGLTSLGFVGTLMASTSGFSGPSKMGAGAVRASGMFSWSSGTGVDL